MKKVSSKSSWIMLMFVSLSVFGQKEKDNGLVILLQPKTATGKGEIFIATGYGLEGVLPDATLNGAVIDNEMIPRFKQGDYFSKRLLKRSPN